MGQRVRKLRMARGQQVIAVQETNPASVEGWRASRKPARVIPAGLPTCKEDACLGDPESAMLWV